MKNAITIALLLTSLLSFGAKADCVNDRNGNSVCGKGECAPDELGHFFCADSGGGAMRDDLGNIQCGVGYCVHDYYSKVWCSKEPGGGATRDSSGKVKCLGGCEPGSKELCSEAR